VPDSEEIEISKQVLPDLPLDYKKTRLGDQRGARSQYRSASSSLHVREYDDKFTIHIDKEDPRKNPLGHLLKDSPETIATAVTTLYFAKRAFERQKKLKDERASSLFNISIMGTLFASFLTLNTIFRFLKTILFH
jgi:hypothetical protein